MKPHELALYEEFAMDISHGAGRALCFICGVVFRTGERALAVPTDCDEGDKMRAGLPYRSIPAHRVCMERVP